MSPNLPLDANAQVAVPTAGASVEKTVLDHGLTILTKESTANDIVAVEVLLCMGVRYETEEQAGLSDLIQHLLLKGTTTRTAEQLATGIEAIGARLAASAGRDYGTVSLLCTRDRLDQGLALLFDVLQNATFPEPEIIREKDLTLRRIKAREDQHLSHTLDLLVETHYGVHPYHKPVLGYPHTVERFDRPLITMFRDAYFVPNNMIFSAVGHFESRALIEQIGSHFGSVPARPLPLLKEENLSDRAKSKDLFKKRDIQGAWIGIGYSAPTVTDVDYPAMEVLESITGGSMNSRLFIELREKRSLAYQVGSIYSARPGPSLYAAYIGTRSDQFEQARDGILVEMERLCAEPVTEEELLLAKTYLKGTFIMGQERNISQAGLLARCELMGLGYDFVDRYPALIDKVTEADVLGVARKHLREPYALSAVLPEVPSA